MMHQNVAILTLNFKKNFSGRKIFARPFQFSMNSETLTSVYDLVVAELLEVTGQTNRLPADWESQHCCCHSFSVACVNSLSAKPAVKSPTNLLKKFCGRNLKRRTPPRTNSWLNSRTTRLMYMLQSCCLRRQSGTHSTPVNQRSAVNDWRLRHVWRLADATRLPGNGYVDHHQQTHLHQQRTCKMTV